MVLLDLHAEQGYRIFLRGELPATAANRYEWSD